MAALSFIAMFILMYAMVDVIANVHLNLNQAYMAGLMAAPMVLIELAVMRGMYPDTRANMIVAGVSAAALILFYAAIRTQTQIGDRQFLRSMIPHHAGALLMCEEARLQDASIRDLCGRILASQQAEIAEMKAILRGLD